MSGAFSWNDRYLLGYAPMDETHREFVDIVGAMLSAPDAELPALLDRFAAHAERHFSEELQWMKSTDFPALDCHAGEHEAVMKSVRAVQEVVARGDTVEVRSLAHALADWFPGHADYMDSALAQWLSKKIFGGAPVVLRRNVAP